jgi:hypothetical protein
MLEMNTFPPTSKYRLAGLALALGLSCLTLSPVWAQSCPAAPPGAQIVHYVTATGSATNSCVGTPPATACSAPCNLARAQQVVRGLVSSPLTGDVVVRIRAGQPYQLTQTLAFNESDSGNSGHKVIWQAYPGDKPLISGGLPVTGWTADTGGTYSATVPGTLETRQLWVNDVRAVRARGSLNPTGFSKAPAGCPGANHTNECTGYTTTNSAMNTWGSKSDIEVVSLNAWKAFRCPVATIASGTITMARSCFSCAQVDLDQNTQDGDPGDYPIGLPTWIENARELLDEYGEWYLDRSASPRKIYYMPRYGESMSTATAIAGSLDGPLVSITGASGQAHDIVIQGLQFSYETWLQPNTPAGFANDHADFYRNGTTCNFYERPSATLEVANATRIEIEDNTFIHVGRAGVGFRTDVDNSDIVGNFFSDISGSAILVADPQHITPVHDIDVENNYITRAGAEYFAGEGIGVYYAHDSTVAHNEVFSVPYNGIQVGLYANLPSYLNTNDISFNLVHNAVSYLADGGLIYTRSQQHDTTIHDNFFHNQTNYGAGLYIDNDTNLLTASDNVVLGAPVWRILNQGSGGPAIDDTLTNNWSDKDDWKYIEAENYFRFSDNTPGNAGGAYRSDDVDIYACAGCSNGYTVGNTAIIPPAVLPEWLEFDDQSLIPGDSSVGDLFEFSVAKLGSAAASLRLCLTTAGVPCGTSGLSLPIPDTGSWTAFQTIGGTLIPAVGVGPFTLRLEFTGGFNIDYLRYRHPMLCCRATTDIPPPTDPNTVDPNQLLLNWSHAPVSAIIDAAGLQAGYRDMPGASTRYEAEDFNIGGEGVKPWTTAIDWRAGYHDLTAGNGGGAYRNNEDVDVYQQWSASNGYTVGGIQTGEWLRYNIDIRNSATYAFDFATATTASGNSITLEVDGATDPHGTLTVPVTGTFDHYQVSTVTWTPTLSRGFHRVRLLFNGPGFTFDYFVVRQLP